MDFTVIIPTYHTPHLCEMCIRSFERFKPEGFNVRYIVVENSNETAHKEKILALAPGKIRWFNNEDGENIPMGSSVGSNANASAIEVAKVHVQTPETFIVHDDVIVTSEKFFTSFKRKMMDGNAFVAVRQEWTRINAAHMSGLMVNTRLLQNVSVWPNYDINGQMIIDVCDSITVVSRENNWPHHIYKNTISNAEIRDKIKAPYDKWHVDRCIDDDGDVIFMHLGRGVQKAHGTYFKAGRITHNEWLEIAKEVLA